MTTIKINNKTITIANKSNESLSFGDIDKESKSLESLALNIEKSVEALNIISNIKAIESFGYKSTEGVGEKIKAGVSNIKDKIIELLEHIADFLKRIFKPIINYFSNMSKQKAMQKECDRLNALANKLGLGDVTTINVNEALWNEYVSSVSKASKIEEIQKNLTEAINLAYDCQYFGSDMQQFVAKLRGNNPLEVNNSLIPLQHRPEEAMKKLEPSIKAIAEKHAKVKELLNSNEIINSGSKTINVQDLIKNFNIMKNKIESMHQFESSLYKLNSWMDTELNSIKRDLNELSTAQSYLNKIGLQGSAITVYKYLTKYSNMIKELSASNAMFIRSCCNIQSDIKKINNYIETIASNIDKTDNEGKY